MRTASLTLVLALTGKSNIRDKSCLIERPTYNPRRADGPVAKLMVEKARRAP